MNQCHILFITMLIHRLISLQTLILKGPHNLSVVTFMCVISLKPSDTCDAQTVSEGVCLQDSLRPARGVIGNTARHGRLDV